MKTITVQQSKKLEKLAKAIKSHHQSTEGLVKSAKQRSREAVAEAILAGHALREAKSIIGHGGFMHWLKSKCGVSQQTASNYMRLANYQHVGDLKDAKSLRQAYIMVGILEDSDPESTKGAVIMPPGTPETNTPQPIIESQPTDVASVDPGQPPMVLLAKAPSQSPSMVEPGDELNRLRYLVSETKTELDKHIEGATEVIEEIAALWFRNASVEKRAQFITKHGN